MSDTNKKTPRDDAGNGFPGEELLMTCCFNHQEFEDCLTYVSRRILPADYRRTVTWKYICRGFLTVFSYAPPLLFIALGSFGALELFNLYKQGEIQRLWLVAMQTELTFDLVGADTV